MFGECRSTKQTVSDAVSAEANHKTSFHYQMANLKAHKIVTLIKFSKLHYPLQEVADDGDRPYHLTTSQGGLYEEYQIINYIINDSYLMAQHPSNANSTHLVDEHTATSYQPTATLHARDIFRWAKMNQQLYELRQTLFPLMDEYYRCLLGHDLLKKSRYEALGSLIKKEIMKLDNTINENPEMFQVEDGFLMIIIACELFMGCKFVFEEKFRNSKSALFSRCDKVFRRAEFEDMYGRVSYCVKQFVPAQFEEQDILDMNVFQESMLEQLEKLLDANSDLCLGAAHKRNQLLYTFFRNILKSSSSKTSYFPYFWLMYDSLNCTLLQLENTSYNQQNSYQELEKKIGTIKQQLAKVLKSSVDYGFIGIYQNEQKKNYRLKVYLCLGSRPFDQFRNMIRANTQLCGFKANRLQISSEHQRHRAQQLWEHQREGVSFCGVKVALLQEL